MKSIKILKEMFLGESVDMTDEEWSYEYERYVAKTQSMGEPVLPFEEWLETMQDFYQGAEDHLAMPGEDPRNAIKRVGKSMGADPKKRS